MAHPDDAEFSCAGTLVKLSALGWKVHIATASPGDCGSPYLPADEIAAIRRAEATAAAATIGAVYHCLEERDVNVIFSHEANRKAIDLFRQVNPKLVFTHPRLDYMLDHEQTHLLARSAAFSFPIPNASPLPLPERSEIPYLYYVDPLEGRDPYTGETVESTTLIDISDVLDRKADMLACHASQREWLRSHHGNDEYIESMRRRAAVRGAEMGTTAAEGFIQHRGPVFPQDDLLGQILGGTDSKALDKGE